ncbi:acyl-ACP--UDP-N-acetylglucosamine O-acyltransferase [Lacibacter luteus]|uniref:Acyl-ACP--UDP-N-acetylglucosamine O-acyltransferase n=1 Tax=Lacibacter luteus TaxID=2508719 RepID=A0A4Q1CF48_9BACT|nr:acyl-ACP--UDP-N-acetylglucosamine O-acyltransferase [Lacibacter luteus]RXK58528.1 acyl-ACP--UDP-N-acetylglucosamine O-acyltransferase [Lacibacter luteus]
MISNLAHIHPNAQIGANVTIDPFAVIHDDVVIGDGTHVMSNVTIFSASRIGKNCNIFPGAVIGAVPQDLKYRGEYTLAEIGDNTTIRECVTIHRGTTDKNTTKVGSNCLIMAYAHVAHDCIVGNNVILANSVQLAGHVTVDDFAIIGGMSAAHQFTHIGKHTYIAGMSAIRKDVPPYVKAAREPLSYVGINNVGLSRRGYSKETIEEIFKIYHILFVEKHIVSKALELIEQMLPSTETRDEILAFIKSSGIGIIKRHSQTSSDEDIAF